MLQASAFRRARFLRSRRRFAAIRRASSSFFIQRRSTERSTRPWIIGSPRRCHLQTVERCRENSKQISLTVSQVSLPVGAEFTSAYQSRVRANNKSALRNVQTLYVTLAFENVERSGMSETEAVLFTGIAALIAAVISAVASVIVAGLAHIKERDKERRQRRLDLLEKAALDVLEFESRWNSVFAAAHTHVQGLPEAKTDDDRDYINEMVSKRLNEADAGPNLFIWADKLKFFGFDGCASALDPVHEMRGEIIRLGRVTTGQLKGLTHEHLYDIQSRFMKAIAAAVERIGAEYRDVESTGWRKMFRERFS